MFGMRPATGWLVLICCQPEASLLCGCCVVEAEGVDDCARGRRRGGLAAGTLSGGRVGVWACQRRGGCRPVGERAVWVAACRGGVRPGAAVSFNTRAGGGLAASLLFLRPLLAQLVGVASPFGGEL